jgi:glycosyltransferase involved in cell wall biosynthesis
VILFGHPGGNPNSHNAALAHYEAGRLEAFCVPWMPTPVEMQILRRVPGMTARAARLERRSFAPLLKAPRVEGGLSEWSRLIRRLLAGEGSEERLAYEANDWLMRTMKRECRRETVTAVHAYEDCSLMQFEEARRLGKACIYDMPIGYYPAWVEQQAALAKQHADWLPQGGALSTRYVREDQKRQEMALADLVLVPSTFVQRSIARFSDKRISVAPYGVDLDFWRPLQEKRSDGDQLTFIYAGQSSLRKGIPLLLQAWRAAALQNARLDLVGSWQLARERLKDLPPSVRWIEPLSRAALRERYQASDVFVFPSFFEGFGLVLLESMACGLPAIATEATAGPDILDRDAGRVIPTGDLDALVDALRWFDANRQRLPEMRRAARARAEACTWENYRRAVSDAVAPLN